MKNRLIYISATILFVLGVVSLLFVKTSQRFLGLSCVLFGTGIFIASKQKGTEIKQDLIDFDTNSNILLKDVEEKGEESEYIDYVNKKNINKARRKYYTNKIIQQMYFKVFAVVLCVIGVYNLF